MRRRSARGHAHVGQRRAALASVALLLPELGSHCSAQQLSGGSFVPSSPVDAVLIPPNPGDPVRCPRGFYPTTGLLYGCHRADGRRVIRMRPASTVVVTKLPRGLENFTVQVATNLNVELQLQDAVTLEPVLKRGRLGPKFGVPKGPFRYRHTTPGTEELGVQGAMPAEVLMRLQNFGPSWGSVELRYRFGGLRPCPAAPVGCSLFEEAVAQNELWAFSAWAQWRFHAEESAWRDLLAVAQRGAAATVSGRRLGAPVGGISWLGWKCVCDYWGSSTSSSGWMQTFHFLDSDLSGEISRLEFRSAYDPNVLLATRTFTTTPMATTSTTSSSKMSTSARALEMKGVFTLTLPGSATANTTANTTRPVAAAAADAAAGGPPLLAVFALATGGMLVAAAAFLLYTRPDLRELVVSKGTELSEYMGFHNGHEADTGAGSKEARTHFLEDGDPLAAERKQFLGGQPRRGPFESTEDGSSPSKESPPSREGHSVSGRELTLAHGYVRPQPDQSCCWGRGRSGRTSPANSAPQPAVAVGVSTEVAGIIQQMKAAIPDPRVQEACLRRLEHMVLEPEHKRCLANCDGSDTVISAMYAHPASGPVQEFGCGVLGNQASGDEAEQLNLVHNGVVRAVVKAMLDHPSNAKVQEAACWALRELAMCSDGRKEVQEVGGVDRIICAMQLDSASANALEHGCMAIAYMAYDADLRKLISMEGGINRVLKCMQALPEDPVVQEAGCLALRNLSCSVEPRKAVLELQGGEDIVETMWNHSGAPQVLETALDALTIISPSPERLAELGALEQALSAMQRHPGAAGLHAKACRLMTHMGSGGEEAREHVRQLNAHEQAHRSKLAFPSSEEVQEAADEALMVLHWKDDDGDSISSPSR